MWCENRHAAVRLPPEQLSREGKECGPPAKALGARPEQAAPCPRPLRPARSLACCGAPEANPRITTSTGEPRSWSCLGTSEPSHTQSALVAYFTAAAPAPSPPLSQLVCCYVNTMACKTRMRGEYQCIPLSSLCQPCVSLLPPFISLVSP